MFKGIEAQGCSGTLSWKRRPRDRHSARNTSRALALTSPAVTWKAERGGDGGGEG